MRFNAFLVLAAASAAHVNPQLHRRDPGQKFLKSVRPDIKTPDVKAPGVAKPFCNNLAKRATLDQIMYMGNTGRCGYMSNMREIGTDEMPLYDHTIKFTATDGKYTCSCFNKMGPDGKLDGAFRDTPLEFTLEKGESTAIACDTDTQGVCACGFGSDVPRCSPIGQRVGSWAEFDMSSRPNNRQSGADVSVLAAQDCGKNFHQKVTFPGMRICANGDCCSWVKKDGVEHFAAYIGDTHDLDGIGCTGYEKATLDIALGDQFSVDE